MFRPRLAGRRGAGVGMLGLAVEGSTALALRSDRLEVLGAGAAHVFIKEADGRTITWHTLKSGDKAMLKRNARGDVLLARRRRPAHRATARCQRASGTTRGLYRVGEK